MTMREKIKAAISNGPNYERDADTIVDAVIDAINERFVAIYNVHFFEDKELNRLEIRGKDKEGVAIRYIIPNGRPLVVDASTLLASKGFGPPSP